MTSGSLSRAPRTGAELLVDALAAHEVRHLFTVSGSHVLSIYDATIGRGIELIHTRHEASAVHMADAWGRLTGRSGVALVTGGPGHLNALSACYGARLAESPLVLLSGHCAAAEIGRGAFQEMDQVAAAEPVTKAAWLATDAARLGADIGVAFDVAVTGRPGPVHVSLPTDVLEARVPDRPSPPKPRRVGRERAVVPRAIREVVTLLAEATWPMILTGPAMARGERGAAVARLSEVTGIPALPMESPRGVDDPWLHAASRCLGRADLVLLLGKRPDFSVRFGGTPPFAESCRLVWIGVDATGASRPERLVRWIEADPWVAAERLAMAAGEVHWKESGWRAEVAAARAATPPDWDALRRDGRTPIHPLRVCAAVQPYLDAGAWLVSDGGEFGQWAQAGLETSTRLINGPSGSIGSAIPMALAAKLVDPRRAVFVTLGDGTFGYAAAEFDTALRYDLPIVAVVGNDARWNAEYQLQLRHYGAGRAVGCELRPSRYDRVVEALGGHGELVEDPARLDAAVRRAVTSERPACVNVRIDGLPAPTF